MAEPNGRGGWDLTDDDHLRDALSALSAYDGGSVQSGIHDEELRARCIAELKRRGENLAYLSRIVRDLHLTDEAIEQGYSIEDVAEFLRWLADYMEYDIR